MRSKLIPSRLSARSNQNKDEIDSVLQECLFCTVSCAHESKAFAIPTGFCLYQDKLIIHGSIKSHFLEQVLKSEEVCITAFIFDGLVLAASAFHHSVNYRAVVLFSKPEEITNPKDKYDILKAYTEKYVPGRWDSLRAINDGELKATRVLSFDLSMASIKLRNGPPSYEAADANLGIWTGVIPSFTQWGQAIQDPNIDPTIPIPEHVNLIINGDI
ncbi:MAG TPA: pyridoxamine 5'-phosphate oxidase family protein [Saprospiraceae bacterium]|nr:pyridoxamine 5'-phosphate oxidase family protein [Saprospiraceae bacterium]